MLESYTTLGYLAGVTERIRLGTLVTGDHLPQPRPPRQDRRDARRALRRPRAVRARRRRGSSASTSSTAGTSRRCAERYALLEDALELLPLMWGPGAPRFEGRTVTVGRGDLLPAAAAGAHPDPRRRLGRAADAAARRAPRRRLQPVRRRRPPCATRSPCCTRTARPRGATRPRSRSPTSPPARVVAAGEPREGQGAATVEEHVGRYRELAEAGVQTAIVGLVGRATGRESVRALRRRDRRVPRVKRLAAALVVAVLFAAGCGGSGGAPKLLTETVGSGPQTTTIIRPDVDRKLPVVLFLHGWGGNRPRYYRPWLEHLAREGNAVIYPRYQDSVVEPPPQVLGNVLAGIRAGARARRRAPGLARGRGPLRRRGAGRRLRRDRAQRRAAGAGRGVQRLPGAAGCRGCRSGSRRSTRRGSRRRRRVVALAGTNDRVVGTRPARRLARLAGARRRQLRDRQRPGRLGPPRPAAGGRRGAARVLGAAGPAHSSGVVAEPLPHVQEPGRADLARRRSPRARRRARGRARRRGTASTPATAPRTTARAPRASPRMSAGRRGPRASPRGRRARGTSAGSARRRRPRRARAAGTARP